MKLPWILFAAIPTLLFGCISKDKNSYKEDPRFNSGREFETGNPIKPRIFHFDSHSFVLGRSEHTSTLGMFNGDKEILFLTSPDGSFDSVAQTTINADDLNDYLVFEKFEDGWAIDSLVSVTPDSFKHNIGDFMNEVIQ
jgi:hypothetical protein